MKKIQKRDILLINSVLILLLIIFTTYAWMVKEPSSGQSLNYSRKLVMPGMDFSAKLYVMVNENFVEQDPNLEAIALENMEPGSIQRYKMEIHNNTDVNMSASIKLSRITGDIELLKNYIYFGVTAPVVRTYQMASSLVETNINNFSYIDLLSDVNVDANETTTVYWFIQLSNTAENDVMNKELSIGKIIISSL